MDMLRVLFFGSTFDSVIVLQNLYQHSRQYQLVAVVTQPPRPIGRKQIMTPTPVETWAKEHTIPFLSFETQKERPTHFINSDDVVASLEPFQPDLVISASFGQLIPWEIIQRAHYKGINIHPSLLPRWRGADPIPWAILSGDTQTGVSVVTLSEQFDEGRILSQQIVPITNTDHREALREKLFTTGATDLTNILPSFLSGTLSGTVQDPHLATYARRLVKNDGFIPWTVLNQCLQQETISFHIISNLPIIQHLAEQVQQLDALPHMNNSRIFLDHVTRALSPWPGVWTLIPFNGTEKRMKILSIETDPQKPIFSSVQLEGKNPTHFSEIKPYITC